MKVTVITAVLNGAHAIMDCIRSIIEQSYPAVEHIIVDGGSIDGTLDLIKACRSERIKTISEADNGLYDAMNKGIQASTGDVIATLNADDMYANKLVLENVVLTLSEHNVDSCYADLVYVDKEIPDRVIRYWKSGGYSKERFKRGWMPPHPTFFVKKCVYERYGLFNTDLPIAADYEMMLRLLYKYDVSTAYIPKVCVKMRTGGKSTPTLINVLRSVIENRKAWKMNNLHPIPFTLILKPLFKLHQYAKQPRLPM